MYLHWNGERDTVEPLLRYCELKGYRTPSSDDYGWARLCQVVGNFFGGTLSVGIMPYSDDGRMDPGDNGIYIIEEWRIADRILPYEGLSSRSNTTSTRCSAPSTSRCPKASGSETSSTPRRSPPRSSKWGTRSG